MPAEYEVTLAQAVKRMLVSLTDAQPLAEALLTELAEGPNAEAEVRYDGNFEVCQDPRNCGDVVYTATPLSVSAYTALHRGMTDGELKRLAKEQRRPVAARGVYVVDILPAELGFYRRPRPLL